MLVRILTKTIYWLAVLAVSVVVLVGVVLFFASRDSSNVQQGAPAPVTRR